MKVSCVMVTSYAAERRALVARSLESYCRQSHADRELIVVTQGPAAEQEALAETLQRLDRPDVRWLGAAADQSLGALRNLALDQATGEALCQWDDDALFHPLRIERQVAALAGGDVASILAGHFSYHEHERRLVVIDWRSALMKGHPATVLMRRDLGVRYPAQPLSPHAEDASLFYELLRKRVPLVAIDDMPQLFVSRFHGTNATAEQHYRRFVTRYARSRAELVADEERLTLGLGQVLLEVDDVSVDGCDGPAFSTVLRVAQAEASPRLTLEWRRSAGLERLAREAATPAQPKVSCLMVTSFAPARREFLAQSLECYARQTYANRELVVVGDCEGDDQRLLTETVARLGRSDTRVVLSPERHTLGALRNMSVAHATGEFVCQWDDDDLFHPRRIERQIAPLLAGGAHASLIGAHFSYFQPQRRMVVVDWRTTLVGGHPGTLTMRRALSVRYPEDGSASLRGEDSVLFHQLRRQKIPIAVLHDEPELFVYRFHGENTWDHEHHDGMVSRHGRTRAELLVAQERLTRGLREVFTEESSVAVAGRDEPAFVAVLQGDVPSLQTSGAKGSAA